MNKQNNNENFENKDKKADVNKPSENKEKTLDIIGLQGDTKSGSSKPKEKTTSPHTDTNSDVDLKHYIFKERKSSKPRKPYRRKKKIKKALLITGISILSLLIVVVGVFLILNQVGKSQLLDTSALDITPPEEIEDAQVEEQGRIINYNGSKYQYNDNLTNILFMGIDEDVLEVEGDLGGGGQADSLFIMSIDTNNGDTNVLAISRDTMEDINVYTDSGEYVGVENMQIALSYAYGDGGKTSCENTVTSVSRLMYGIPINSYFSFEVEAIPVLNDLVGGVEVTATSDVELEDRTVSQGETVTLHGDEAETYVRGRDITQEHSNAERMERQISYVEAFASQAIDLTVQDLSFPLTLYDAADDYMYTNLNVSRVTYLATTFIQNGNTGIDIKTIDGEIKQGEKYEEFYPDEEKLFEQMLDMFYYKIA